MRPRSLPPALVLAAALATVASATGAPTDRLPPGSTIAGIDVSGLGHHGAQAALEGRLGPLYETPVEVRIGPGRSQLATARAGQTVRYSHMVDQAFAQAGAGQPVNVRLERTIDRRRLASAVAELARPFYRAPRNARVRFGIKRIARIRARNGRGVDTPALRAALRAELRHPTPVRAVRGRIVRLRPAIVGRDLPRVYATYISVDRPNRRLRLFKRLRHVKN